MTEDKVENTVQAALDKLADRIPHAKQELPRVVTNTPRAGEVNDARRALIPDALTAPYGLTIDGGYEHLHRILMLAYDQAANGKGKERHSKQTVGFRPWHEQPIMQIGRMTGTGYHTGQVQKKVQEAVTMAGNGGFAAAKAEALGAIVYAAAFFKLLEEIENNDLNNLP